MTSGPSPWGARRVFSLVPATLVCLQVLLYPVGADPALTEGSGDESVDTGSTVGAPAIMRAGQEDCDGWAPYPLVDTPSQVLTSRQEGIILGTRLTTADVNGDGRPDLVAIADNVPLPGEMNGAVLVVYFGSVRGLPAKPDQAIRVEEMGTYTRRTEASVSALGTGDVDGDGFDDILVDAWDKAFVLHGGPAGLSQEPAWRFPSVLP